MQHALKVKFCYHRIFQTSFAVEQTRDAFIRAANTIDVSAPGAVEALGRLATVDDHLRAAIKHLDAAAFEILRLAEIRDSAPVAMNPQFPPDQVDGPGQTG